MRGGRVAVRQTQRQRFRVRPTRSMGLRLTTFVIFPGKMCFVVFTVLPSSLPLSGEPVTHVIVCGAAHQESVWVQEPALTISLRGLLLLVTWPESVERCHKKIWTDAVIIRISSLLHSWYERVWPSAEELIWLFKTGNTWYKQFLSLPCSTMLLYLYFAKCLPDLSVCGYLYIRGHPIILRYSLNLEIYILNAAWHN